MRAQYVLLSVYNKSYFLDFKIFINKESASYVHANLSSERAELRVFLEMP